MAANIDLNHFRNTLINEITDAVQNSDLGGIREEKFAELALEYLEEASETEGAVPCREIRENSIGNRVHKINGYAISEGHETVDLFITVFKGSTAIGRIYADELKGAVSLSTRFFSNVLNNKMEGIEETAPVFDFVRTIRKIAKEIVRANIYILSDALIPYDPPGQTEIGEIRVHYHIRDIEYLYRIYTSGSGRESIELNFKTTFNETIPCLFMPAKNEDYESYLAFVPAHILADIYRDFGSRLLEQNIRTFLQFRGNINKGIRDTILREPHMFMAYNNGISATAESVELNIENSAIISIKDFQIVNGGQTTASIFQTRRKFKNADIHSVCVQLKLTVISDPAKKPEIVSRISRYANTQNKVSEADLSSNHPFHVEVENLSRKIWTTPSAGKNQSRWFYERARGQYNDELSKIDKPADQKKWLARNPKPQQFAKEDLARFYNSWEMMPWWVVRGRQKSFIEFMHSADDLDTSQIFYEDLISKAIIFRTAEKLYGSGPKAIGDLRYMVVPYTVSWLRFATNGRINLSRIWKQQSLSKASEALLLSVLQEVDAYMRETAPGGLIGEWAKKEECWKKLSGTQLNIDLSVLEPEYYTGSEIKERYSESLAMAAEKKVMMEENIRRITTEGWMRIDQWGKTSLRFGLSDSNFIWKIIRKLEKNRGFTDKELIQANGLLDIAGDNHLQ